MKIKIIVSRLVRIPNQFIKGSRYQIVGVKPYESSNFFEITLDEQQWESLNKAHGNPITLGSEIEIELPGEEVEEE